MLISIIIPCYNSARFIASTLDMLISQGLSDCEIIVVNDGSKDNTSEIVHNYTSLYPEIQLINKQNEGVSIARNTGMDAAKGKYIYFLDSDDTLVDNTLEFYRQCLKENLGKSFFAFGYYTKVNGKIKKDYAAKNFNGKIIDSQLLKQSFFSKKLCFHICSCIYEKLFLQKNGIYFPEGVRIGEDSLFLLDVFKYATECIYYSRHCYVYQIREDSVMQGYTGYKREWWNSLKLILNHLDKIEWDKTIIPYKNFFTSYSIAKDLFAYLKVKNKDTELSEWFVKNKMYFNKKMKGKYLYILIYKILYYIPLRLILL